jgi:hypothetical protein
MRAPAGFLLTFKKIFVIILKKPSGTAATLDTYKNFWYNIINNRRKEVSIMDLYEALKSGTNAEELRKTFEKELKEAQSRVSAEQEKEWQRIKQLSDVRHRLAEMILDYTVLALGEDCEIDADDVKKIEMALIKMEAGLKKSETEKPMKLDSKVDDEVIRDLLKWLL